MDLTTEPPCLPVAPRTVMVSFAIFAQGLQAPIEEMDKLESGPKVLLSWWQLWRTRRYLNEENLKTIERRDG